MAGSKTSGYDFMARYLSKYICYQTYNTNDLKNGPLCIYVFFVCIHMLKYLCVHGGCFVLVNEILKYLSLYGYCIRHRNVYQ